MKIESIESKILKFLSKSKGWVFGGVIERQLPVINKPATISRTLRAMAEANVIYKDYKNVGRVRCVVYKFK